jgi:hypothetical protein
MNALASMLSRWLTAFMRYIGDPFRLAELADIEEQMKFWHAEEIRALKAAHDAFNNGNMDEYESARKAYNTACYRCKTEVADRLKTFRH